MQQVKCGLQRCPVTAILRPRQAGKTTSARAIGQRENAEYLLRNPRSGSGFACFEPFCGHSAVSEVTGIEVDKQRKDRW
jgi:hypothetical protein